MYMYDEDEFDPDATKGKKVIASAGTLRCSWYAN
jgi:hypothetical protein